MKKVYLFEDHDRSLRIWRENGIEGLDLVHVDAHIDFGFHPAEPIEVILDQARSVADLKRRLEYSQAFSYFEKDFSKQVDIGNYIYPAMREGIVKDFYWVVPGGHKEFTASREAIMATLKQLIKIEGSNAKISCLNKDLVTAQIFGRKISVSTLGSLPLQDKPVILDIDIDFLVISNASVANNTAKIGRRNPWISAAGLKARLEKKVLKPKIITVAYSCNGGYTPMKFRYLGDELAYLFAPVGFKALYKRNLKAAQLFESFLVTGQRKYYNQSVQLNPVYRSSDNNYGPLYLSVNKPRQAQQEFARIYNVDPSNPGALVGLGWLALNKKDFKQAKACFFRVLRSGRLSLFKSERISSLIGLAQAEYGLGNLDRSRELLIRFQKQRSLDPFCRYLLGQIAEKQKNSDQAARCYIEAIRLGLGGIEVLSRLAKISFSCKEKKSIIGFIKQRLDNFKREGKKIWKIRRFYAKTKTWSIG